MFDDESLFIYSLSKSYDELSLSIEKAKKDLNKPPLQLEVSFRLGTCLHWLIDCWERVEKNETSDNDKSLFSALRYANNELKHNIELVQIHHRTGGFTFPIHFPFVSEIIAFRWVAKNQSSNGKWKNQLVNYQQLLQGKEVLSSISLAIEVIQKYTQQIESEVTQ